jgi:hypothetical protein
VQAKSDKEKSELRAQFAREQPNHAKKREIAAFGRQLGEEPRPAGSWDRARKLEGAICRSLRLDEIPTDPVQDHKIIERIIPEQNDEQTERMKLKAVANIKKFSHSKRKEENREDVETHYR